MANTKCSLQAVIAQHDLFSGARTLPNVLGDAYLYCANFPFRVVRDLVVDLGFSFASCPPFPYADLPLLCLEDIWEHRVLPFVENVPALRVVEQRSPGLLDFWEVAESGLKKTGVFHESVHCVARAILRSVPLESTVGGANGSILDALFEESCANACDAVASASGSTRMQRLFGNMHFFGYGTHPHVGGALEKMGFSDTLQLLVIAYLYSNFLYLEVPRKDILRIAARVVSREGFRALEQSSTIELFRAALRLNPAFRVRVTGLQLKRAGHEGSVFELLDFDFASELAEGSRLRTALALLVELLEGGFGARETLCRAFPLVPALVPSSGAPSRQLTAVRRAAAHAATSGAMGDAARPRRGGSRRSHVAR